MNQINFFVLKLIRTNRFFTMLLSVVVLFTFSSCSKKSMDGMILLTQISENIHISDSLNGASSECFPGAQILVISSNKLEEEPQILTSDFFSACLPEVSYDGKFILFSAQKEQVDKWQIWQMNLENRKTRQLTFFDEDCFSPAYLPGGRFIFSKIMSNDSIITESSLFSGFLDGTEIQQITFNPHVYSGLSVLKDGRILAISRQIYPKHGEEKLMVLRPDGTKQELFYQGSSESKLISRFRETEGGKIFFTESENDIQKKGNIISIKYNNPLSSRTNLTSAIKGNFYSVSLFQKEKLLTVFCPEAEKNSALYTFSTEDKTMTLLYKKEGYNIVDAVVIAKKERPRILPSEVNTGVKTGLLLCQDINFLGIHNSNKNISDLKADKIEVIGMDSTLGFANVEDDGSVYLKILADTPFRLQTLSSDGEVINGPGNWIYLRPNERRGCVGCHVGNDQAPFNRQALSVKKDPVFIPNHLKGVREHKVSL